MHKDNTKKLTKFIYKETEKINVNIYFSNILYNILYIDMKSKQKREAF